jgi:hypothetical protein
MKVRDDLRHNPPIASSDADKVPLEIDEVEARFGLWKLAASEGFVFFESEGDCS